MGKKTWDLNQCVQAAGLEREQWPGEMWADVLAARHRNQLGGETRCATIGSQEATTASSHELEVGTSAARESFRYCSSFKALSLKGQEAWHGPSRPGRLVKALRDKLGPMDGFRPQCGIWKEHLTLATIGVTRSALSRFSLSLCGGDEVVPDNIEVRAPEWDGSTQGLTIDQLDDWLVSNVRPSDPLPSYYWYEGDDLVLPNPWIEWDKGAEFKLHDVLRTQDDDGEEMFGCRTLAFVDAGGQEAESYGVILEREEGETEWSDLLVTFTELAGGTRTGKVRITLADIKKFKLKVLECTLWCEKLGIFNELLAAYGMWRQLGLTTYVMV